jgi:hypothetical protein
MTSPKPIPGSLSKFDESQFSELAVTPGGAHFLGTTPNGTKIVYDRQKLLELRNSPLSKTPVENLPRILTRSDKADDCVEEEGTKCGEEETGKETVSDPGVRGVESHLEEDIFPME